MVLSEREKLKAQVPNISKNMNVSDFLAFRSDKIKHLSFMVPIYSSAQEESSHNADNARAVKRCSTYVCAGLGKEVSY